MWHGLLVIDKPEGVTSHDVVGQVRRLLGQKAVGHAGTLDPLATGVLVLLLGQATKLSDYVMSGQKKYLLQFTLGVETDTLDSTGQEVRRVDQINVSDEQLKATIEELKGPLELPVPAFSAIKVRGQKLYEQARKGQSVAPPRRVMHFLNPQFIKRQGSEVWAQVSCEKGGYIRSWVCEAGRKLKVGAHLTALRRTESAPFTVDQAIPIEELVKRVTEGDPLGDLPAFIPMKEALPAWRTLTLSGKEVRLVSNGQIPHDVARRLIPELKQATAQSQEVGVKLLSAQSGELVSLLAAQPRGGLKIKRVFQWS